MLIALHVPNSHIYWRIQWPRNIRNLYHIITKIWRFTICSSHASALLHTHTRYMHISELEPWSKTVVTEHVKSSVKSYFLENKDCGLSFLTKVERNWVQANSTGWCCGAKTKATDSGKLKERTWATPTTKSSFRASLEWEAKAELWWGMGMDCWNSSWSTRWCLMQ